MINFNIYCKDGRYYIKTRGDNVIIEIPARYIKIFICVFSDYKRAIRLGRLFENLIDNDSEISISEYDLLVMIRILYTEQYNLASGEWLINYYQDIYEDAHYELKKVLPR